MKEGEAKRRSAVWVFVSGGVLIAAAIIALYTPWLQVCDVREVVVIGNQHASASDLANLAQLRRSQTIFSVPVNRVQARLQAHPWIKNASVRRVFPHTISLVVEERRVLAWARHPSEDVKIAIAEGGIIVGTADANSASLELVGAAASGWNNGDCLAQSQVADLIAALQSDICQLSVRSVDVTNLRSIELFLENDLQVRLGEIDRAQERLRAVRALCQEIEIDGYELIDVRFGGEATLVPRKAVRR